ncbi:MAG: hypothetical protein ABI777_06250, partial [Betaproteobacteria bacterium]
MASTVLHYAVDVLMERIPLENRWVNERWQPRAIEAVAEELRRPGEPTCLHDGPDGTLWRFP